MCKIQHLISFQCFLCGVNGQAAVWRVDLANKQEQEHVIKIVMAFKMMISQKHKIAIMATVQVNIDALGTYQNKKIIDST